MELTINKMMNKTLKLSVAGMWLGCTFAMAQVAPTIKVDLLQRAHVFEGIGALSAGASSRLLVDYPEQQREDILDFLFKPKFGASLHHLKVEIGGDVNSTSGTEPSHARTKEELENPSEDYYQRGYEWWLMKEAKSRNSQIMLDCLAWGAPGWIGDGKYYSDDGIRYMKAFLQGARKYHQLSMDYTGIWNERMHDTEFIIRLKKSLLASGLDSVKIVGSDLCCGNQWTIAQDMLEDERLVQAVDVIGDHYPETNCGYNTSAVARSFGKPLWNSEGGPWKGNWDGFAALAKLYNRDYIVGKMTKTITWSLVTSYYENLALPNSGLMKANTPWSGHYEVEPALWAVAHTTQFAQPGWWYVGGKGCSFATPDSTVSYVTLVSPDEADYSLIIESIDAKEVVKLTFNIQGNTSDRLHVYRSIYGKECFVKQKDIRPRNGRLEIMVEPGSIYSLTTTSGQQKGTKVIPASSAFPFPYTVTFEDGIVGKVPRYLSDQGGAFEVIDREDGEGKALRQVITRPCIEWEGAVINQSVLGDTLWSDYTVSSDVHFPEPYSYAEISGRLMEIHRSHTHPEGYVFRLHTSGKWSLSTSKQILTSGFLRIEGQTWNRLSLSMNKDNIRLFVNDQLIKEVQDSTYTHGMAGIGASFNRVDFDNIIIKE